MRICFSGCQTVQLGCHLTRRCVLDVCNCVSGDGSLGRGTCHQLNRQDQKPVHNTYSTSLRTPGHVDGLLSAVTMDRAVKMPSGGKECA